MTFATVFGKKIGNIGQPSGIFGKCSEIFGQTGRNSEFGGQISDENGKKISVWRYDAGRIVSVPAYFYFVTYLARIYLTLSQLAIGHVEQIPK